MIKVVYLSDTGIPYEKAQAFFEEAAVWAQEQCSSYINFHVQDVSDVSLINDLVAEYRFRDPKDAVWFELKWR